MADPTLYGEQNGSYSALTAGADGSYTLNGQPYSGTTFNAANVSPNGPDNYTTYNPYGYAAGAPATPAPTPTPATPAPTQDPTTTGASGQQVSTTPGSLSTTPGQLAGTTLSASQMQNITNQNVQNATNPTLSASETAAPVNQQVQSGELMSNQTINPSSDQVNTGDANIQASTVGSAAQASTPQNIQAAQYQAAQVDLQSAATAITAAQSALPADALVSTQLQQLLTPRC